MGLRKLYVDLFRQYRGCETGDAKEKFLVDVYNLHVPLPRGLKMQYSYSWCACSVSAVAFMAQLDDIIPFEMGCWEQEVLAKQMGIWKNPPFTPQMGDLILYDWANKKDGMPDHVGVVEEVNGDTITVIEGNMGGGKCGERTISLSDPQILGFITPDYEGKEKHDMPDGAEGYDPEIVGNWTVTTALYLRKGAGANTKALTIMPKGAIVDCDGYLAVNGKTPWYHVKWNGREGFCSSKYLQR
jgi:hypothetical protein